MNNCYLSKSLKVCNDKCTSGNKLTKSTNKSKIDILHTKGQMLFILANYQMMSLHIEPLPIL